MRRFRHILPVAAACLMTLVTSALDGAVLCRTGSGHTAIEPPHQEGSCSGHEAAEEHSDEGESPFHEPCVDVQIDGTLVREGGCDTAAPVLELAAFAALPCSLIPALPPFSSPWFNTSGQPPGVGDAGHLGVVLLN